MSKKTNAEKHKRITTRPRRGAHKRIKRPAKNVAKIHHDNRPLSEVLFADPIFMHYLAAGMLRLMELTGKLPPLISMDYPNYPPLIDAEFPELPDEFKKEDKPQ